MFGYVVINKPDMTFRDFDTYRSFYCGLCRDLKDRYGLKGQVTLNYDLTFLAVLLTALYEDNTVTGTARCIAHPFSPHTTRRNEFTEYASDMNILLTYYKCLDDWKDDKKLSKKIMSSALKKSGMKVAKKYPEKAEVIAKELERLNGYEQQNEHDIDLVSGCFGRMMSEIFVYKQDEWSEYLRKMGFYLGKYIYILDAYSDYEDDIKNNCYNALDEASAGEDRCRTMLTMMMAECSSAYEMLPIVEHTEILNNIIYSGVWTGFNVKGPVTNVELFEP